MSLSHLGHSTGCSLTDHCCRPDYGQHPHLAMTRPAPPTGAQQAQAAMAPKAPLAGVGYRGVPTTLW
jgi:hypothetical protein